MKNKLLKTMLALTLLATADNQLPAQGTAFTYQGRLNFNGRPAAGNFDLTFAIFATNATGSPVAMPTTNSATAITNGLFSVPRDFSAGVFTGPACWLEISARTNGGGAFLTLMPRQLLTPAPHAIFANTASNHSGTLAASQLTGTVPKSVLAGFQGSLETAGGGQNNTANNTYATVGGGYDNTAGYQGTVPGVKGS